MAERSICAHRSRAKQRLARGAVRWKGAAKPEDGLDKPTVAVTFKTSANVAGKLTVGALSADEMWSAAAEGLTGVFAMSKPDEEALVLPLLDKPAAAAKSPALKSARAPAEAGTPNEPAKAGTPSAGQRAPRPPSDLHAVRAGEAGPRGEAEGEQREGRGFGDGPAWQRERHAGIVGKGETRWVAV